jgi:hypothetical protein
MSWRRCQPQDVIASEAKQSNLIRRETSSLRSSQ